MDQAKIEAYLSKNGPKLPESKFAELRAALAQINDDQLISLESVKLKSPTTMTLIAWLLGFWAIDRFAMGQILYGVIKLLTCGGAWVWWITDIFTARRRTREYNYAKLKDALAAQGIA